MTTLVRGLLGAAAGAILAYAFAEYASFGATVASHWLGGYVDQADAVAYASISGFCASISVLIIAAACFLLLEFVRPASRSRRKAMYVTLATLAGFAILHMAAVQLELVRRDLDPMPAVVGALATNAWLILVAVAASWTVGRSGSNKPILEA